MKLHQAQLCNYVNMKLKTLNKNDVHCIARATNSSANYSTAVNYGRSVFVKSTIARVFLCLINQIFKKRKLLVLATIIKVACSISFLYLSVSFSLSLCLFVSVSLSVSISFYLSVFFSLSLSLFLSVIFSLFVSLSVSQCLSFCHFLSVCFSLCVSIFVFLSLSLCLFVSLSLPISLSLYLSPPPSLSFFLSRYEINFTFESFYSTGPQATTTTTKHVKNLNQIQIASFFESHI
jgi:hypothetical protein